MVMSSTPAAPTSSSAPTSWSPPSSSRSLPHEWLSSLDDDLVVGNTRSISDPSPDSQAAGREQSIGVPQQGRPQLCVAKLDSQVQGFAYHRGQLWSSSLPLQAINHLPVLACLGEQQQMGRSTS